MTRFPHLLLYTALLATMVLMAFLAPGPDALAEFRTQDEGGTTIDPPADRVVVRTSQYEVVGGTVAREDESVLVIETPDGLKSFVKARTLSIVRLVDPDPGQRGRVLLTDGSSRSGIILQDGFDEVVVEIAGIKTRFNRSIVDRVELMPTIREQYDRAKETILPEQLDRRLDLCRWLLEHREYRLALTELESLRADRPGMPGLTGLLTLASAQVALMDDTLADSDGLGGSGGTGADPNTGPVQANDVLPTEIVSEADVNIMRVYEIDFRNPPHVEISPETIRQLIMNHSANKAIPANAQDRTALFRADPTDVARLMFQVRARELYPEINVTSEPYSLNLFRQRVHDTWLIKNCATSRCHGGVRAGRFFLHNRNYRDSRVRATNLLILERVEIDPARPLINYDEPNMSVIIQYGLPVTEARFPHPDVPGWKPVFMPAAKSLREDTLKWIRSMYQPRPDYPIDYSPPILEPDVGGAGRTDR